MEMITVADFQRMLSEAARTIESRSEEFSKMDAALGDGDHGEAITTAMRVVAAESEKGGDFKTMLSGMGFEVMMQTSGSTSTLLGGFFLGMSDGVAPSKESLNCAEVAAMFRSGLVGVQKNTKAAIGDKSIMDALIPAVEALSDYKGSDVGEAMAQAAQAALAGAESTKSMVAKFGRARNLGDKVIGHVDAGASSWAEMFNSFSRVI